MTKNTTGPAQVVVEKPVAESKTGKKPGSCAAGFYCYIGPNLTGLIQNGAIFRGDREDALRAAASAIEQQPLVQTLIVSGDALPEARLNVKRPGNALSANYEKIAASKRKKEGMKNA